MPSSSASPASSPGSPPPSTSPDSSTMQNAAASLPAALVEGVANLDQNADSNIDSAAAYAAPSGGDGDSDGGIWDIIAESHPNLESYADQQYDQEMSEPMADLSSQISSATTSAMASSHLQVPSTNLPTPFDEFQPAIDTSLISGGAMPTLMINNHLSFSAFASPSHFVTFEKRQDGAPFPLSKPIVREDGLLLVGTEVVADSTQPGEKNRLYVTNFLNSSETGSHFHLEKEVRDLQWIDSQAAIVAVGEEIQLIQLGDASVGGPCRVQDPINTVHSDSIRELAVSPTTNSYVLSGGFDETVVLTDLRNKGDPKASRVIGKFDAYDVVSSVRWSPDSHMSWTTDGGDFQVADARVRSPQLQVPLYRFLDVTKLGGLFTHEYLGNFNVALGFEKGYIALLDIRKTRQDSCTSLIESKLSAISEIRRSLSNKFSIFGHGGFSTADLNSSEDSFDDITAHQQPSQIAGALYKTSGDFSRERGAYLAVSDSMGVVSVYTDDSIFATTFGGSGSSW